jgi:hypothetical protein
MGALLANKITDLFATGKDDLMAAIAKTGDKAQEVAAQLSSGTLPEVRLLPEPVRSLVEDFYAQAISHSFLIGIPLAVLSLVAILFLPNAPLTRMTTSERAKAAEPAAEHRPAEDAAEVAIADAEALAGAPTGTVQVVSHRTRETASDGDL